MKPNSVVGWMLVGAVLGSGATLAQEAQTPGADEPQDRVEEVIVVTASRTEQSLNEAPAAITVLDARTIESIPADDYGDLLRNVPGLNVSQTSARDINMTGPRRDQHALDLDSWCCSTGARSTSTSSAS